MRIRGTVTRFFEEKGFGFIAVEGRDDVFVHIKAVQDPNLRTIQKGQVVEFEIVEGRDGRPAAGRVMLLGASSPGPRADAVPSATARILRGDNAGSRSPRPPRRNRDESRNEAAASPLIPVRASVKAAVELAAESDSFHVGLRFYKYVDTWTKKRGWSLDTESKRDQQRESRRDPKREFLERVIALNDRMRSGDGAALLADAHARVTALTAGLANQGWVTKCVSLRTSWRFVSGLGISHPFETGLALHHTLGVPFLPGPSVKGAARDIGEQEGPPDVDVFGDPKQAGQVVFFDALPVTWPALELDIVNPHYGDYYEDPNVAPGDWLMPVPVNFLAIAANQAFRFIVAARARESSGRSSCDLATKALSFVEEAAKTGGLGGKSSVGYGYFI